MIIDLSHTFTDGQPAQLVSRWVQILFCAENIFKRTLNHRHSLFISLYDLSFFYFRPTTMADFNAVWDVNQEKDAKGLVPAICFHGCNIHLMIAPFDDGGDGICMIDRGQIVCGAT